MSAAVADYRPADPADAEDQEEGTRLGDRTWNPPRTSWPGWERNKPEGQFLVGFALETNDDRGACQGKLERKNLDLIVLNSLKDRGAGFGHDTNKVTLIAKGTDPVALPLMSKVAAARAILDHLEPII